MTRREKRLLAKLAVTTVIAGVAIPNEPRPAAAQAAVIAIKIVATILLLPLVLVFGGVFLIAKIWEQPETAPRAAIRPDRAATAAQEQAKRTETPSVWDDGLIKWGIIVLAAVFITMLAVAIIGRSGA